MKAKFQLIVTCAIIQKDDKILITQRPEGRHNALRWEFPGGKAGIGEDLRECVEREITEEMGITVKANDLFEYSSQIYEDDKRHVILFAFKCDFLEGEIALHDINDYKWVTLDEIDAYDITEADLPFIATMKRNGL